PLQRRSPGGHSPVHSPPRQTKGHSLRGFSSPFSSHSSTTRPSHWRSFGTHCSTQPSSGEQTAAHCSPASHVPSSVQVKNRLPTHRVSAAAHSAHASPLQPNAQGSCSAHSPPSQRNVHPSSHLVTPSSQTTLEVPVPEAPPAPAPPSEAFPPAPASRRLKGPGGSSPAPPCGASPPAPAPCELPTLPPPPPDESDGCDARQVPSSHHCPGGQCSSRMHATSVGDGSSIPSTA